MSKSQEQKTQFERVERITLWVGAVCGIVVAILTVWNHLMQPAPPDLHVAFALTGAPSITIVDPNQTTASFPLDLIVENKGGTTAENVRLKLADSYLRGGDRIDRPVDKSKGYVTIQDLLEAGFSPGYSSNLRIETNKELYTQNALYIGDYTTTITTVPLGQIHAGESTCLESVLNAQLYTNHGPVIAALGPGDEPPPKKLDFKHRDKHHRIITSISAQNSPERDASLEVFIRYPENIAGTNNEVFTLEEHTLRKRKPQTTRGN